MLDTIRTTTLACLAVTALVGCAAPVRSEKASLIQVAAARSAANLSTAQIEFVNDSGQVVKIFWVDFEGHQKLYQTLKVGESYVQKTYLNHPWLVTDASDNVWYMFFADAQPRTVDITRPAAK